ncbi:hypothetical protein ACIBQX_37785 [Nonomuraea sp. NPDC049714]|uniref:hypothetical protein n=1 Tax=Nonomuraea sp. NPDC049714 TaxID=3364357 RepID=UPI003799FE9C
MGSRTAISAGILAVALATVAVAAPPAMALAGDCERGGGLLSGVTDGLCDTLDAVTGTVDDLTGGLTEPVTKGLDKTTDTVLGKVGEAVPTSRPSSRPDRRSPRPSDSAEPRRTELLPETLGEVCLPVLACEDQAVLDGIATPTPTPTPDSRRSDRATPSPEAERERGDDREHADVLATDAATPPDTRPHTLDEREPATERRADPEDLRFDLLWPNPFADELALPVQKQRIVRPSAPASDVVGTALTIILLATAVLATRIVQQRKQRSEQPDSIPFEPARQGNSRHRLA